MHQPIESRRERTTVPVFTGRQLEAERERESAATRDRPSLAHTRYALPLVREFRAVG